MSNLLPILRADITNSIKSGNVLARNILKVIVGEAEMLALRQNKNVSDDIIYSVIKKAIEGNETTISLSKTEKPELKKENEILKQYLPKTLNLEETIVNLNDISDQIKSMSNIGQATGLAMKNLKTKNLVIDSKIVIEAINKIRSG